MTVAETSTADDTASKYLCWIFLGGFLLVTQMAYGIYAGVGVEPSQQFVVLESLGTLGFIEGLTKERRGQVSCIVIR